MYDCNRIQTHNHLVRKWTLSHLVKLAKWLSCVVSTYLYDAFDGVFLSCHIHVLEWIYTLQLHFIYPACLERRVPTFKQLQNVDRVCDMMRTHSQSCVWFGVLTVNNTQILVWTYKLISNNSIIIHGYIDHNISNKKISSCIYYYKSSHSTSVMYGQAPNHVM